MDRASCEACQMAYAPTRWDTPEDRKRKAGGTPCATCRPALLPENAEAVRVYQDCADQLIVSMDRVVGLNALAVMELLKLEGWPRDDRRELLEKVRIISRTVIRKQGEKAEAEREDKRRNDRNQAGR